MEETLSPQERELRGKGLALVARLERLVKSDTEQGFRFLAWLQIGLDQVEAGQVIEMPMDTHHE